MFRTTFGVSLLLFEIATLIITAMQYQITVDEAKRAVLLMQEAGIVTFLIMIAAKMGV